MAALLHLVAVIGIGLLQTSLTSGSFTSVAGNEGDEEATSRRSGGVPDFLCNYNQWTSKVQQNFVKDWCDTTLENTVSTLVHAQTELATCKGTVVDLKGEADRQLKERRRRETEVKDDIDLAEVACEYLKAELVREKTQVEADLAACLVYKNGSIPREECDYQVKAGCAQCNKRKRELELQVEEILDQRGGNSSQSSSTDQCGALQSEIHVLQTSLGRCRVEKANAASAAPENPQEQEELISDLEIQVRKLEKEVKQLRGALLVSFLVVLVTTAAAFRPYVALNRRGVGSLNDVVYGQVTPVDRDVLSQHFCASDEACEKLRSFERVQFRNVTPILTFARSSEQTGREFVFMLVPLNASSARRFSLFGGGGDYTRTVEVARDLVSLDSVDTRLVIVLYEQGGRAFASKTLRSLNMSADALAYEALPKDSNSDFPSDDDLVVLWYDDREGLKVTDSGGESQLSDLIRAQEWAQHLAKRAKDILVRSDRVIGTF